VHLIYYVDFVFAGLWCKTDLLHEAADVIDRVVAGGIEFVDVERRALIERNAGMAFITGFSVGLQVFAVDGFCENACAGSFAHSARSAKEKCMRELVVLYGVF
jgi:hypothetical protein